MYEKWAPWFCPEWKEIKRRIRIGTIDNQAKNAYLSVKKNDKYASEHDILLEKKLVVYNLTLEEPNKNK